MKHGVCADKLIWDTDMARLMQIIYSDSYQKGATLRYTKTIESQATNQTQQQLEGQINKWLSEQQ